MIEIERRVVHLLGVTATPDGPWAVQFARNLACDLEDSGRRFRFCIRDRDAKFTASFDDVLASVGIETIQTPVASPRANAFAERFVRTVQENCPRPPRRRLTATSHAAGAGHLKGGPLLLAGDIDKSFHIIAGYVTTMTAVGIAAGERYRPGGRRRRARRIRHVVSVAVVPSAQT